ncbi:MAG: transcriptional repressor [Leptospirales bacterium]|nr:transcriptional repressor [Leptospirales bacterium]
MTRDIHKELSLFSEYLKKAGLKITNQRLLVAETIFRHPSHFTVDSLADSLKERKGEISRATIYRIVSILVESGQLTEHNFAHGVRYYEHIPVSEHHDHLVCLDCGIIDEFMVAEIEKVQTQIAQQHGFVLAEHSLNLYGRCIQWKDKGSCTRKSEKESAQKNGKG